MQKKDFSVFQLENHETKDVLDSHINGELTVIWRNWDEIINKPEMIYLNSVNPGEIKGLIGIKIEQVTFFAFKAK